MWVWSMFDGDNNEYVMWLQHAVYGQAQWNIVQPCQEYMAFACKMFGSNRFEEMGVNIDRFDHRTLQDCAHDILAAVWRYRFRTILLQLELPFDLVTPLRQSLPGHLLGERKIKEAGSIYARELDFEGFTEMSERMLKYQAATRGTYEPITIHKSSAAKNSVPLAPIDLVHMRQWLDWLSNEVHSWQHEPHLMRYVMTILTNQNKPEGYKAESYLACELIERFDDVPWPGKWARAVRDSAFTAEERYSQSPAASDT